MGRVELIPLSRALATRLGIRMDAPFIGFAGVEHAPESRGKRSIVLDKKRVRVLGVGGLQWREGLCWLFLDGVLESNTSALVTVRAAKTMISKAWLMGERMVVVARDEAPRSKKLLTMLGFQQLPELPEFQGIEVWMLERWPPSPLSPLSPQPQQP